MNPLQASDDMVVDSGPPGGPAIMQVNLSPEAGSIDLLPNLPNTTVSIVFEYTDIASLEILKGAKERIQKLAQGEITYRSFTFESGKSTTLDDLRGDMYIGGDIYIGVQASGVGLKNINGKQLAFISQLEQLESLSLYGSSFNAIDLQHLSKLKKLKKLAIWDTNIGNEGFVEIVSSGICGALASLSLARCGISNILIKPGTVCPLFAKLETLNLHGNNLRDPSMIALGPHLTSNLKELNLHTNSISDAGVGALVPYLPQSLMLDLSKNPITAVSWDKLRKAGFNVDETGFCWRR